ncbi:hypothetical protein DVA76_19715, partial [Acinetobacter baumannii]
FDLNRERQTGGERDRWRERQTGGERDRGRERQVERETDKWRVKIQKHINQMKKGLKLNMRLRKQIKMNSRKTTFQQPIRG